ncbi:MULTISPECIES: Gfo/Idh/MocA family protein [unclassified Streptomyces]|uniref:Gfo/Idh/MocA family protein n=1 Tax=unclassified Streptomyces TaxID=2593676 RepID=UPI00168B4BE1|nr:MULTISPECIES: Gfo/Idh/MocA family oxidoreductase [unclassified Streptomyces]MBD3010003.1 Gfo/Idh/MocA family oxidoreductase [Streptomyces sp. 5-10]
MPEQNRIGVGLISVGVMGRLHARSYLQSQQFFPELPTRAELVIAADPDPNGRAYATEALGFRETTNDYRKLLAHPDVDVVSICSPNFLHHEIALATIDAGKHFWIEKPMGRSARESREIAQGAAAAGLFTAVGFNYRHAPAVAEARRLIRSGELGRITNLQIRMITSYASDPTQGFTWRYEQAQAGSGVLGDVLSHGFDLAQFLVAPITSVNAVTERFIPRRPLPEGGSREVENEDYAALLARFDGGAIGIFETTRVAIGPHAEYIIEVYGTKGSLRWNFDRMNQLELADNGTGYRTIMTPTSYGEFGRFQPNAGPGIGFNDLKTIEAALFLRSVAEGVQLAPSAADGWSASELVDVSLRSAESGQWVDVPAVTGATTTQA